MSRAKKVSYKAQRKYFSKTAGNENVKSINSRPRPQRTGFRV